MENKNNDRGNSSEQRKRLMYAREHMKGRKYKVLRPEQRQKYHESDENTLNTVVGTLTGSHHDTVRRFENTQKADNAQVYGTPDTEKIRQMQKARFIQKQLESEQKASVYVKLDEMSYQPEKPHDSEFYEAKPNIFDYEKNGTQPNMYDKADHARDAADRSNGVSLYPESRTISNDPQLAERLRKAQFIREQLERNAAVSAIMSDPDEDIADATVRPEPRMSEEKEHIPEQHTFGADNTINSTLSSMIPTLSDEQKADIQRSIKQKQYENRLEEHRQTTETITTPTPINYYADYHHNNTSDTSKSDALDEVSAVVSYAQSVQTADIQSMVTKPVTDVVKRSLSHTAETVVDGTATITQSVSGTDDMQAIPYNIGMILAENEGKKLAYKLAKGEDILVEKEQARVQERMAQSKYRFVEPEKHRPKVEKRESIQEEQKRRFIKSTENKKAEVCREAEHKAKESIYLKANRKEDGLIGKILGEDKKYHPKGKAAVIAGAGAAVLPILLLVIVVMFICAVFSWLDPHEEKLYDSTNKEYKTQALENDAETLQGYVSLIQDIFDEKQLEVLQIVDKDYGGFDPDDYQYERQTEDENNNYHDYQKVIRLTVTLDTQITEKCLNDYSPPTIKNSTNSYSIDYAYGVTKYWKTDPQTGRLIRSERDEGIQSEYTELPLANELSNELRYNGILTEKDKEAAYNKLISSGFSADRYNSGRPSIVERNGKTYSVTSVTSVKFSYAATENEVLQCEALDHGNDIWDLYQYGNKWLKLSDEIDCETIIALTAIRKFQKLENGTSEDEIDELGNTEETATETVYHLTREDFEETVSDTYVFYYAYRSGSCPCGNCCVMYTEEEPYYYHGMPPHQILIGQVTNWSDYGEDFFLQKCIDDSMPTYESDKQVYEVYKQFITEKLGTEEKPAHTIIDYENDTEAQQRLIDIYELKTGHKWAEWRLKG